MVVEGGVVLFVLSGMEVRVVVPLDALCSFNDGVEFPSKNKW